MAIIVSKSSFKPKVFEYFRMVEKTHKEIYITDHGKLVLKIIPYEKNDEKEIMELRNLVEKYDSPYEPLNERWDAQT